MKQREESHTVLDQQINFLKKIPFFQNFDDHELKQLLAVSRWLKVPSSTLIIKEDTLEKVFYILVKGSVSVFITMEDGQKVVLTRMTTGATFGEMALISETRRSAGVITTSESYILMVEPDILNHASVFLQLKFYRRFCEILVSRLIAANKRMGDLTVSSASTVGGASGQPPAGEALSPRPVAPAAAVAAPVEKIVAAAASKVPVREQMVQADHREQEENDISNLPPAPKIMAVAKEKMKRRIQDNVELAVNPAIAARLTSFLVGDCEDTRKFAELISCDPMLAARVIQQANSSFYRRSSAVNSVPHAMVTMGIRNVQEVVAKETGREARGGSLFGGFGQLADGFWRHAAAVGRIAELLKDTIRLNISEDVYLAGLFHDLGKLTLDQLQPLFYPQQLRPDFVSHDICAAEHEYIGIDHGQAGCWLGEKMGIPQPYLDVMLLHHTPEKARDNSLLIAIVHLADLFAKERGVMMGRATAALPPLYSSFGWVVLQEQHHPFLDINLESFLHSFNDELDRRWEEISRLIAC